MVELARVHGISLPPALTEEWPPQLSTADERGWFRFQRLYDVARSVLRTPDDLYRLVREIAEDERAEGSGWLELQADPSGFAAMYGGITAFTELLIDAAEKAARAADIGIGIIVAANRTRHPMDARMIARLAAQFAGQGVVGFGLSNDERRGPAAEFVPAFRIADRAGLLLAPHAGELVGPPSVRGGALTCCTLTVSGTASARSRIRGWSSGSRPRGSPARCARPRTWPSGWPPMRNRFRSGRCSRRGCPIALGADDPVLFGRRLVKQYEIARDVHAFTPPELAELARQSLHSSAAPPDTRARLLAGIDAWLAGPTPARPEARWAGFRSSPRWRCGPQPLKADLALWPTAPIGFGAVGHNANAGLARWATALVRVARGRRR